MLVLFLKLELLEIPRNYVTLDSIINQLSALQPNHQQEEHYIANHLSHKPRNYLNIYKNSELESTFVEIINPKKSNIIVGVMYRHHSMVVTDFTQNYLNGLLDKISYEKHISSW